MKVYEGEIVEVNYDSKGTDADGDVLPAFFAKVKTPWLETTETPDPVSDWIPVYMNWQHTPEMQSWEPIYPGMQVMVMVTDQIKGQTSSQMVAWGYGPANDEIFEDKRQTSMYHKAKDGSMWKWVFEPEDPVEGNNDDYGFTFKGADDFNYELRLGSRDDPTRKTLHMDFGNGMTHDIDMSDGTQIIETVLGPITMTADGIRNKVLVTLAGITYELDGQGNSALLKAGTTKVDIQGNSRKITASGGGLASSLTFWGGPTGLQLWLAKHVIELNIKFATKMDMIGAPGTFSPPTDLGTKVLDAE